MKKDGANSTTVYTQGRGGSDIGGYDLRSPDDRMFAFDYNRSGRIHHLELYRPGTGTFWILRRDTDGKLSPVYQKGDPGNGIGGYDLRRKGDRAFAFDWESSGKMDHLVLYRPGAGTFWVLKKGDPGNGVGGYDLWSPADVAMAYDWDHSGKQDHIALYRPGTSTLWVLKHLPSGGFQKCMLRVIPAKVWVAMI
ncbi:hypothetical protein QQZ08_001723 [Neonectria magnoliae]|uniref:Uncharacterized protein n=1 Tax=Neonectria magnoliae TaxID=2732573 RepID=A0ABR1IDW5_9HYPO